MSSSRDETQLSCWCRSEVHQHDISKESSINLCKTLLRVSCKWKIALPALGRRGIFEYSPPSISKILDLSIEQPWFLLSMAWQWKPGNCKLSNMWGRIGHLILPALLKENWWHLPYGDNKTYRDFLEKGQNVLNECYVTTKNYRDSWGLLVLWGVE